MQKPEQNQSLQQKVINEINSWVTFDKDDIVTIGSTVAVILLVRTFIAEPRYIPSLSMYPSFDIQDRLIAEKITYKFIRPPQRGDVVIFRPPKGVGQEGFLQDNVFIKRVVAVGGDTIEVKNNRLYVDDVPQEEDYIYEQPKYTLERQQIPSGYVFVNGDNRNNSYDSHFWGPLQNERIIGRVCFLYWPINKIGLLPEAKIHDYYPPTQVNQLSQYQMKEAPSIN